MANLRNFISNNSYNSYEKDKKILESITNNKETTQNIFGNYSEFAIKIANDIILKALQQFNSIELIKQQNEDLSKQYKINEYSFILNQFRNKLIFGTESGYIDKYNKTGLRFSTSSKEKALMLIIPIKKITQKFNNYINANITFNITGNFNLKNVYNNSSKIVNENNVMYIGFRDNDQYWLLERGTNHHHLNWHYGTFIDDNIQSPTEQYGYEQIHQGGGNFSNLSINIEFNKKSNTVILKGKNGDTNVEWIVPESSIPSNNLEFIIYRNHIDDEYEINNIKCNIKIGTDNKVILEELVEEECEEVLENKTPLLNITTKYTSNGFYILIIFLIMFILGLSIYLIRKRK